MKYHVVQPGVFDYQSNEYVVRLRLWGIGFPERDQPGFNDAISASERLLLGVPIDISVKQEFDSKNLKVVQVHGQIKKNDLGREIISQGFGWHLDDETDRYGPYVLSQLKAKRLNLGVWSRNFNYLQIQSPNVLPTAKLPGLYNNNKNFIPSLTYWVTSFGRIHRPGCSFTKEEEGI